MQVFSSKVLVIAVNKQLCLTKEIRITMKGKRFCANEVVRNNRYGGTVHTSEAQHLYGVFHCRYS